MTDDLQTQLLVRAQSAVAADKVITADEVAEWPPGTREDLVRDGVLEEIRPATIVECDACFEGHVEIVDFIEEPPGSGSRAYIACPEAGRVAVDTERMRRWKICADSKSGPSQADGERGDEEAAFAPSADYTSVRLRGEQFLLAPREAAVIEMLHQAYRSGAPELRWSQIRERLRTLNYFPARMHDVFKQLQGWNRLIDRPRKGFYRLNL